MKGLLKVVLSSVALLTLVSCTNENAPASNAEFSQNNDPVYYEVVFVNYNDTFLYKDTVLEGSEAQYRGETPTREADDEFTYEFKGWDQDISNITSNVTVTATFEFVSKGNWGPIHWYD